MAYSVQITSYPEGAKLYLDGKFEDYTNWWLHGLEGNHTIKLTLSGYPDWSCTITPSDAGKTIHHNFKAPTIKETINWKAITIDPHNFYLFSLFGKDTNGIPGGFQIEKGNYVIITTPSMSRFDDLITPDISKFDCLTIIAENFDGSTISGIYSWKIDKNVII